MFDGGGEGTAELEQAGGGRAVLGLYVGNLRHFEPTFDEFYLSILAVIAGFYSLSWLFVICYDVLAGMSLAWRAPISVQKIRHGARDGLRFYRSFGLLRVGCVPHFPPVFCPKRKIPDRRAEDDGEDETDGVDADVTKLRRTTGYERLVDFIETGV